MACSTISTSGTVTLTAGTLDGNFCHTSWQNTLDAFVTATGASITSGALFAANSTEPATNMLWLKQDEGDSCAPLGWYYYDTATTSWLEIPLPAASLPTGVVTPGTKGSSTMNAQITVDTTGRVTGLTEVAPAAESTDGHAKAWVKFSATTGGTSIDGTAYNVGSVSRTSLGNYIVTTSGVTFSNSCVAVASAPGFGDDQSVSTASFTGADHVRVATSIEGGTNNGKATLELPRMQHDGENDVDGDENWDNDQGEANGICVVFFGN